MYWGIKIHLRCLSQYDSHHPMSIESQKCSFSNFLVRGGEATCQQLNIVSLSWAWVRLRPELPWLVPSSVTKPPQGSDVGRDLYIWAIYGSAWFPLCDLWICTIYGCARSMDLHDLWICAIHGSARSVVWIYKIHGSLIYGFCIQIISLIARWRLLYRSVTLTNLRRCTIHPWWDRITERRPREFRTRLELWE